MGVRELSSYPYQSSVVPIYSYGPALGLPIITFSIGSYWDNYYRGRPFYGNRNYWYHRPYHPPAPRFANDWHAAAAAARTLALLPADGPMATTAADGGNNRPPPYAGNRPPPQQGHPKARALTAPIARRRAPATTPRAAKPAVDAVKRRRRRRHATARREGAPFFCAIDGEPEWRTRTKPRHSTRWYHHIDRPTAHSISRPPSAAKNAVTSVSFFSNTSLELRSW